VADNFDQQKLKSVLDYDPATGLFRWKTERSNAPCGNRIGTVAGSSASNGYWRIWLFGGEHLAHRLAWLWMIGTWPSNDIDHDNLNRADNKWTNLRLANPSLNAANIRPKKTKAWPYLKGVDYQSRCKTRPFRAQIEKDGERFYLGLYATPEEAKAAYDAKALELFGAFARAA
jgi:hypothetical protein